MHDYYNHQLQIIALCHAVKLPITWRDEGRRHLRVPLDNRHFLDIVAGPACQDTQELTWALFQIRMGDVWQLDEGRVPCQAPLVHALLLAWAGYREQCGRQRFQDWSLAPITPWQPIDLQPNPNLA